MKVESQPQQKEEMSFHEKRCLELEDIRDALRAHIVRLNQQQKEQFSRSDMIGFAKCFQEDGYYMSKQPDENTLTEYLNSKNKTRNADK